jgi:transcriptional regulator GlxA family with amidase domain
LFKATFGLSAHRYVTHVRLAHAEHLMRSTALPLTEIALATGMCDQSHFCHVFRKKFGESPSSWRRSQAAA